MKPLNTNKLFSVLDVETTMNDKEPTRSMSCPFYHVNTAVMIGCMDYMDDHGGDSCRIYEAGDVVSLGIKTDGDLLVGQNIKFDLHYVRKYQEPDKFAKLMDRCLIWDTQIAEYVLSGQLKSMISMDALADIYDLDSKKDAGHGLITATFKSGLGADHIPRADLAKYLKHDLITTGDIAYKQMARATQEQFDLIINMGECLKAIEEMEWNGMHVDTDVIASKMRGINEELITCHAETQLAFHHHVGSEAGDYMAANPGWANSGHVMSALLFGGKLKYTVKVPTGTLYKSGPRKGTVRMKNDKRTLKLVGALRPEEVGAEATKHKPKGGWTVYTTDEDVLRNANTALNPSSHLGDIVCEVTDIKKLTKVLNTYLTNFKSMEIDGTIHHTLNQTITRTGRLSSSKPNLQNVPMVSDEPLTNVKACFTSGYTDRGVLMEIDFKQIEICVLAWLTQDPQLLKDIEDGRDIHTEVGEVVLGPGKVTKRERRDIKTVVFAMIYGAGAKGISKDSGIPIEKVKRIMKGFYNRYDTINDFYKWLSDEVRDKGHCLDEVYRGPHGPEHYFEWVSPTGRTYKFNQDPYRPGPKYTQLRNYPVQGTATGDIVPVVLGEVARVMRSYVDREHVKMVTTTHDSMTFDCVDKLAAGALRTHLNEEVFDRLDKIINVAFPNMKWNVPLEIEVEIGPNWGDMKKV